jgi:hypothetical protein
MTRNTAPIAKQVITRSTVKALLRLDRRVARDMPAALFIPPPSTSHRIQDRVLLELCESREIRDGLHPLKGGVFDEVLVRFLIRRSRRPEVLQWTFPP